LAKDIGNIRKNFSLNFMKFITFIINVLWSYINNLREIHLIWLPENREWREMWLRNNAKPMDYNHRKHHAE